MRIGKELILATKPFANEIVWKSWFHTISTLLLLIISLLGTYLTPFLLGKISCSILSALLLSRSFIIYHDYLHHTILHKSPLAKVIFTLFGVYMISPPSIWKRSHDFHHNHNAKLYSASIGSYPIMTKEKFLSASKAERFFYLSVRSPLNMFFAYFTTFMYGLCIQSFLSSARRHWDSLLTLVIHFTIAIFLFVHYGWLTWFLAFFVPFFLSHMLGAYLFFAQHNFPEVMFRNNTEWTYANAALESSSYMKMNPLMQWFTANIGFHHIHHLNSRIPFYRLPEAMANVSELQSPKITTLKISDIRKCLRLKVWDPEKNKMIGYKEMGYKKFSAAVS
jgi:omega-6 fatty acid desaturase (delta-12 desaturase)